jgi:hypothetical protein
MSKYLMPGDHLYKQMEIYLTSMLPISPAESKYFCPHFPFSLLTVILLVPFHSDSEHSILYSYLWQFSRKPSSHHFKQNFIIFYLVNCQFSSSSQMSVILFFSVVFLGWPEILISQGDLYRPDLNAATTRSQSSQYHETFLSSCWF